MIRNDEKWVVISDLLRRAESHRKIKQRLMHKSLLAMLVEYDDNVRRQRNQLKVRSPLPPTAD